jgi:hypothetical protein
MVEQDCKGACWHFGVSLAQQPLVVLKFCQAHRVFNLIISARKAKTTPIRGFTSNFLKKYVDQ